MAAQTTHSTVAGNGELTTHTTSGPTVSSTSQSKSPENAVEMSDLDASGLSKKVATTTAGAGSHSGLLNDVSIPHASPVDSSFPDTTASMTSKPEATAAVKDTKENMPSSSTIAQPSTTAVPTTNDPLSSSTNDNTTSSDPVVSFSPPTISRLDSVAIGPATDTMPTSGPLEGPVLQITLLLTTGARHPYKIDDKYLTKRSVNVPGVTEDGKKDPFSISVYTLKELILREWRQEWEASPSSPSSIRLIYFGRLLDDKTALKECKFSSEIPNVVHMTVRPQDIVDEEDATKVKGSGRDREDGERTTGCRCVIM